MLLSFGPAETERLLLRLVKALYQHRLRELVKEVPPAISAEILSASEKMTGRVKGFSHNKGMGHSGQTKRAATVGCSRVASGDDFSGSDFLASDLEK